ncbi:MAG: hypothetical protein V4651_10750 [Bacteroidota bacterium]
MATHTKYFRAAAIIACLLFGIGVKAQTIEQPIIQVLKGNSGQLKKDSSRVVEDTKWWASDPALDVSGAYRIKNIISLKLNEDTPAIMKPRFSVTVKIKLFITDKDNNIDSSQTPTLTINYDTLTGASYNTQNVLTFYNAYRVGLRILSVDSAYVPSSVTPKPPVTIFAQIENEMQILREYNFTCDTLITDLHNLRDSGIVNGELQVYWDNVLGATEYDLEWVYIDNESMTDATLYKTGGMPDGNKIFSGNATRVTISEVSYDIPMLYPEDGVLFYRFRPVQNKPGSRRDEGKWSSENTSGIKSHTDFPGHEIDLNWQATTSFAEDGKRKSVVQYYDGSLRSRQTVTKDNTTNTTVVAETFYDYQGRAVIQVLPAPTLSNIISYSRNFNRRVTSDYDLGYTKDLYDTLINPSDYCDLPAPPMGKDSSGASRYYSTSNPEASIGFNKFIPDAELYPFTETRYSQDNTGRILSQSGVGNSFKIGSGHETKYYYGNPDQKEIDALFGTDVGHASHYFKDMVRDANGQYSVTYVDMHGRTIATALAGKVPASLDTLPSFNERTITEKLADSTNNIVMDLVLESSRSILVPSVGDYVFNYTLTPDSLRLRACDSSYVCYDCLYNLEIVITDECNNCHLPDQQPYVLLDSNFTFTTIDTACGDSVSGFHKTFILENLPEGNYTITKRLSISQYGMDYYRDSIFMIKNTCRTFQDFYNEVSDSIQSQLDCSTESCATCSTNTSSLAVFREYYLNLAGIPLADSALYRDDITVAYTEAKESCDFTCGQVGQHTFIRMAMLLDMTAPIGQYANPDSADNDATKRFNIFNEDSTRWQHPTYHDEYGHLDSAVNEDGILVPINQLSKEQFMRSFKDCWAKDLLYLHPEYPKLVEYENYIASHIWDEKFNSVETFAEANARGMVNPVTSTSSERPPHLNYFIDSLDPGTLTGAIANAMEGLVHLYVSGDNLSLWGVASVSGKCNNIAGCVSKYTNSHLNNCMNDSIFCDGELDMAWRSFKQIYQTKKRLIIMDELDSDFPAIRSSLPPHYNEHFASTATAQADYISSISGATSAAPVTTIINGHIQDSYRLNCEDFAASWWSRLAPCFFGVTNADSLRADSTRLIPRLVEICIAGSDAAHNFGSSSVAPGSNLKYKSFEELIRFYIDSMHAIYPTVYEYNYSCNADLINMPQPYDQQTPLSDIPIWTKPDSCQCSNITEFYAKYNQYGNTDSNFAGYVLRKTGRLISNADLTKLLNMCTGVDTCKFLTAPITLPPALQCGVRDVCINCDQVQKAYDIFRSKYPGVYPSYNEDDSIQILKNITFTNSMNNQLGFTKTVFEYLDFISQCGNKYTPDSSRCDSLNSLLKDFQDFYSSINFNQVYRTGKITKCAQDVIDASNAMLAKLHNTSGSTIFGDKGFGAAPYSKNFDVRLKSVTPNILGSGYPFYPTTPFNNSVVPLTLDCSVKPKAVAAGDYTQYNYLNGNTLYPYEFIQPSSTASEYGKKPVYAVAMEDHEQYFKMIFAGTASIYNPSNPAFDYETYQAPTPLAKYIYQGATGFQGHLYSFTFIDAAGINTATQYDTYYDNYYTLNREILYDPGLNAYPYVTGIPHASIKKVYNLRFDNNILSQTIINPTDLSPKYLRVTLDYIDGHTGDAYIVLGEQNTLITYKEAVDTNLYNPDCNKAFTKYFNNRYSTNYTYLQIDSIFSAECGIDLSPCDFTTAECDTLNRITEEYHTSSLNIQRDSSGAEQGIFTLNFNPWYDTTGNAYFDSTILHPGLYIDSGIVHSVPDSIHRYLLSNSLDMCTGPDLTFEFRVKTDTAQSHRQGYGGNGEFLPTVIFDNGAQIALVISSNNAAFTGTNYPFYIRGVGSLVNPFNDWVTVKIVVQGDSAYVYYDSTKVYSVALRGMPARSKITGYYFANITSHHIDWVRIYDAYGQLQYNENFNDITNFAKVPSEWICTSICDTSFTTFFNNRQGTTLNNSQVQELYRKCGNEGADCGNNQLVLCGKNEPLFPDIEFNEPDPCADSTNMIFVKATELYKAYLDSLNNAFDSAYIAKCRNAFKTESFTVTHPVSEYHYTLYYYDQAGNLVMTVPPKGVEESGRDRSTWFDSVALARKNGVHLAPSHTLTTSYRYNTLNQVVEQSTPDADVSTFYYDRLGRLAVSQNAKQYAASVTENGRQYSYTKYDDLGRIIEVGQLTNETTTVITQDISQDINDFNDWFADWSCSLSFSSERNLSFNFFKLASSRSFA